MNTVERMAEAAHKFGTDSFKFRMAYDAWLTELEQKPSHRPPPDLVIHRNGIAFHLQSAIGSDYRYVPLQNFVQAEFCIEPLSPRERILNELSISKQVRKDIMLIEAGLIKPEEGTVYEDGADGILIDTDDSVDLDDLMDIL